MWKVGLRWWQCGDRSTYTKDVEGRERHWDYERNEEEEEKEQDTGYRSSTGTVVVSGSQSASR